MEIFGKSESGKMWDCGSAPKIKAARISCDCILLVSTKLIGLYYQANPFKSGNIRGYQLNSELV